MNCPKCGYVMSDLDVECARCKRLAQQQFPAAPPPPSAPPAAKMPAGPPYPPRSSEPLSEEIAPKRSRLLRDGVIFTIMAVLIVGGISYSSHLDTEKLYEGEARPGRAAQDGSVRQAWEEACGLVKKQLTAPATAVFPGSHPHCAKYGGAGKWEVRSYVESQNTNGVKTRQYWAALLEYQPAKRTWSGTARLDLQAPAKLAKPFDNPLPTATPAAAGPGPGATPPASASTAQATETNTARPGRTTVPRAQRPTDFKTKNAAACVFVLGDDIFTVDGPTHADPGLEFVAAYVVIANADEGTERVEVKALDFSLEINGVVYPENLLAQTALLPGYPRLSTVWLNPGEDTAGIITFHVPPGVAKLIWKPSVASNPNWTIKTFHYSGL